MNSIDSSRMFGSRAKRNIPVSRIYARSFIHSPLNDDLGIVDLGAYNGNFGKGMIERYGFYIYAAKPVPKWYNSLPKHENFNPLPVALGDSESEISINI